VSGAPSTTGPDADLAKAIFDIAHIRGRFRLRSGATSSEYFDKYRFEANPRVLRQIAERMADLVPEGIDALAGLEMGGIPIATMLSQVTGLPALFIRKKAKDYGTCKFAEGGEVRGRRLLIVEDVVTSGGQIIESAKALRSEGAIIGQVVCVIDRESGGPENLRKEGLMLRALFTMSALKAASAGPT
jgi:orotate phosphoribosyltransferase